ncbi:MmcB family DNA repair protein [Leptospira adleri]|uniref:MmcB family DNA repair protein n=1 Tax=Leptospira adleri TaxID=2023186 RepID=A0A2M9YJ70_9LEPT|nr:MmcB family DNA repair protein [Leptospira adleri]PJZ51591.1 hypothetical protein CH380_19285 [Leptospira adleri]PJZ61900.1 hypothetical protein CH376_10880 [Leptospira adleri]
MKDPKITAHMISELLKVKHANDIYLPECKTGPSMGSHHFRMDGWSMPKSWSKDAVTAYEIKVSRSDFLQDEKWRSYLIYCNHFYFVTPPGLINPKELPEEAGLYETSKNGTRLFIRKKSVYRTQSIPEEIFRYVLMWRIDKQYTNYWKANAKERLLNWLETQEEDRNFGRALSGKIRKKVEERIWKVAEQNETLEKRIKTYEEIKIFLENLGIDATRPYLSKWEVQKKIDLINELIPQTLIEKFKDTQSNISRVLAMIEDIEKGQREIA